MRFPSKIALGIAALLASNSAYAVTTVTTTFQAKIIITAQCLINSASILDFGTSGVLAANIDQTSTVSVTCTNTTPYNVGLNAGANGVSVSTRKLKNATTSELIAYSIFSDTGRTVNWGNTVGTDTIAGTGNGAAQSLTLYGRVTPQTTPTPGTYTDTVTVTVTY